MKRHIYLLSLIITVLSITGFLSYSRISRATVIESRDAGRDILFAFNKWEPDSKMAQRVKRYGNSFSAWLNSNTGGMVPAAAAGVVVGNKLVYAHGANANANTRFGIASLSKTFTALLTLRLAEEGLLSLNDPVKKYLPGVVIERKALQSGPVTIRHLLSHTSGIPSYGKSKIYHIKEKTISLPVQVHPAGYSYAYSNPGYALMQFIIEKATGKSYAANMKEQVFVPLNMTRSSAAHSNATGGLVTTINDLAKYTAMLINEGSYQGKQIISRDSFREMLAHEVELPKTGVDYFYSLGWEVITVNQRIDSYYKAGRWFGEASAIQVFPQRKSAFIYLCNPPQHLSKSFMSWRKGLTGGLRYLVRKITGDPKLCTRWPYLTPNELKWYEGKYINTLTGSRVTIFMRNGRLFSDKYGVMALRTFTSNRLLIGTGRMLHNFVWKDSRVIGLALRDGYYKRVSGHELAYNRNRKP